MSAYRCAECERTRPGRNDDPARCSCAGVCGCHAKKVVFVTPTLKRPTQPYLDALEASIPLIVAAGWQEGAIFELGCPYISHARALLTRKALDAEADVIVYLDDDLSWAPSALLALIETEGDVVAGTYRFGADAEEYMMSLFTSGDHRPILRDDGAIRAEWGPAGFLKVTRAAIRRFMRAYPQLVYGDPLRPSIDLFNHGADDGTWWGEDVMFCRRWRACGGQVWIVPDLDLTHWKGGKPYPGNLHRFMLRQPGGSDDPARAELVSA
jgi:hypothetical protein